MWRVAKFVVKPGSAGGERWCLVESALHSILHLLVEQLGLLTLRLDSLLLIEG